MATNKRPVLDLDAEAQAALDDARAMSQGPERAAARRRRAFFEKLPTHTDHLCEAGETHENLVGVVDSVRSKELDYRKL